MKTQRIQISRHGRHIRHFVCTATVLLYVFHIDSLVFTQRIYLISNKRTVFVIRPVCTFDARLSFFLLLFISLVVHSLFPALCLTGARVRFDLFFIGKWLESTVRHISHSFSPLLLCFRLSSIICIVSNVCDFKWMHFSLLRLLFSSCVFFSLSSHFCSLVCIFFPSAFFSYLSFCSVPPDKFPDIYVIPVAFSIFMLNCYTRMI